MGIKVTKASGIVEDLDPDKLRSSLQRSGASRKQSQEIIDMVINEISPFTSTAKIYSLAKKYLKRYNRPSSLRYSLKRALLRLGPTGYPFEKYVGELMKQYGYSTEVGTVMEGKCVNHEIDVIGIRDGDVTAVECKYHNTLGKTTDVKVAMYVHSRFRDIEPVFRKGHPDKTFSGWLVTNTRCTKDAIQYADCSGFGVIGWRHPSNGSLEKMIEDRLLYPVTIISGIKQSVIGDLLKNNIILLKDLVDLNVEDIRKMLSLNKNKAVALKRQADDLCLC